MSGKPGPARAVVESVQVPVDGRARWLLTLSPCGHRVIRTSDSVRAHCGHCGHCGRVRPADAKRPPRRSALVRDAIYALVTEALDNESAVSAELAALEPSDVEIRSALRFGFRSGQIVDDTKGSTE